MALRAAARRIRHLDEEIKELDAELEPRVRVLAPALLDETGIGPVNAAEMLCAWSHPGRVRSEAAFASLAGAAPIPASSGQTVRHRLDRHGDRRLNRALHSAVLVRCVRHAETRRYVERRRAEGKTDREIRRCLKRFLARRVYKILEAGRTASVGSVSQATVPPSTPAPAGRTARSPRPGEGRVATEAGRGDRARPTSGGPRRGPQGTSRNAWAATDAQETSVEPSRATTPMRQYANPLDSHRNPLGDACKNTR